MATFQSLELRLEAAYKRLSESGLAASTTKPGLQRAGGHKLAGAVRRDSYISYKHPKRDSIWLAVRQMNETQAPYLVLTRKRRGTGVSAPIVSIDMFAAEAVDAAVNVFLATAVMFDVSSGSWRSEDNDAAFAGES